MWCFSEMPALIMFLRFRSIAMKGSLLWSAAGRHRGKGLVTNYGEGGATKREGGGHVKFDPYEKGGQKKF